MGAVKGKDGNRWYHVRLPGRPSGHTGWILADQTIRSSTEWRIVVNGLDRAGSRSTATASRARLPGGRAEGRRRRRPTAQFFVEEAARDLAARRRRPLRARHQRALGHLPGVRGRARPDRDPRHGRPLGSARQRRLARLHPPRPAPSRGSRSASAAECRSPSSAERAPSLGVSSAGCNETCARRRCTRRSRRRTAVSPSPGSGGSRAPATCARALTGRTVAFRGARLDALEGQPQRAHLPGRGRRLGHAPGHARPERGLRARAGRPTARRSRSSPTARVAGSAQLYALERASLGEARQLTEAPGIVEHHEWSPDGSRILLLVAGHGAEQTDALGSGTLGAEAELPEWVPLVDSSESAGEGAALALRARRRERRARARPRPIEPERLGGDLVRRRRASSRSSRRAPARVRGTAPSSRSSIRPRARARTLRRSEVQLGWAAGSPGGTHVAVVEAVCSDRMIVAGELLLIDPASGEARTVDTHGVDVTWTAWRDDERLLAIGVRGLEPVALDVRRRRRRRPTEIWVGIGLLRRRASTRGLADRRRHGVRGRRRGLGSRARRRRRRRRRGA